MELNELSGEFLIAVKTNKEVQTFISLYEQTSQQDLQVLDTDEKKKAFWVNTYNAFTKHLLKNQPKALESRISRHAFFTKKQIHFKDIQISLDQIEHDFLRRSKIKWSKGFLSKTFISDLEKKLRVDALDPRIHFALNCGAISCPPIKFYDAEHLSDQLDMATESFLDSEVTWNENKNELLISPLFDWYKGDFKGEKGVLHFIKKYKKGLIWRNNPKLSYSNYDWSTSH